MQPFSKCGPTSASVSSGNVLEMQNLTSQPGPTESKTLAVVPEAYVLTSPPGWVWCTQKIDNHWIGDYLTKIFIFSHFSLKIIRYFLWTLIHTIERTLFNTLCKEDGWQQRSYMMCLFRPNPHPSLVTAQSSNSLAHSLEPLPSNTQLNSSTLRASVSYTVTPGQPHGRELLSFTLPLNRPRPPCSPSSQIPLKFLSSTVRSPRHCCLHKSKCKYL